MAEQRDITSEWVTASAVIGAEQQQRIITQCERRAMGDDDVAAEAVPYATVSVAAGKPLGKAVRWAVAEALRNRAIRNARLLSAEALAESGWDPSSEAAEAPSAPYWEDVAPRLSPTAQRVLGALTVHCLSAPKAYERLAAGTVKINGQTVADAMGLALAPAGQRKGKQQRKALLRLACSGWAEASLWMHPDPSESAPARASRALRWVRRGRVFSDGARGTVRTSEVRVTQRGGRLMRADGGPGAFVPLGGQGTFTAPNDGQAVRSLGYRGAAPVKRIRSPRITDGAAEGTQWGAAGAVGLPAREVPDALAGQRAARATARDDAARLGWERREQAEALAAEAARIGVCPTATDGQCQCPRTRTRGKAVHWVATQSTDDVLSARSKARARGEAAPPEQGVWVHPLTPCESPSADGRCGCGAKRGALVWFASVGPDAQTRGRLFHPARPQRTR
jgi:hypothetical protein